MEKVDRQANQIHLTRQPRTDSNDNPPLVKPIVSVQVAKVAPKLVLETLQDIDVYVEALRKTLLDKI